MAAPISVGTILARLAQETGLGKAGTATGGTGAGAGSTLVAANPQFLAPTTGATWPPNTLIRMTGGSNSGQQSFVTSYVASTGTFTLTNGFTNAVASGDTFIVSRDVDSMERLVEAVDRGLRNNVSRWQRVPVTFTPDGDMLLAGVTNWTNAAGGTGTATNATPTKVALSYPDTFATQCLHCVTSGVNGFVQGTPMNVTLSTNGPGEAWFVFTFVRAATSTSLAQVDVRDVTNNAAITVTWMWPTETTAKNTSASLGWEVIGGTFNAPVNCKQIAPRLTGASGNAVDTVEMGPIMMAPLRTTVMPLAQRVLRKRLGNFYYVLPQSGPVNPNEVFMSNQIVRAGREVSIQDYGGSLAVAFNSTGGTMQPFSYGPNVPILSSYNYAAGLIPGRMLVYDERVFGDSVSTDSDTTTFPLDYVATMAEYQLYYRLWSEDARTKDNYGRPIQSKWEDRLRALKKRAEAAEDAYGPGEIAVAGRVGERW